MLAEDLALGTRSGHRYAAKACLAAAVTGTPAARDAIEGIELAIDETERLLGTTLADDCSEPLTIVTDNGPAFKSADFVHFIARHPELRHVRTRHHAPETNGVVERWNQSLKYEQLYREEIATVIGLAEHVDAYRELYNWVRPHEALGLVAPMVRCLAEPLPAPAELTYRHPKLFRFLDAGHIVDDSP